MGHTADQTIQVSRVNTIFSAILHKGPEVLLHALWDTYWASIDLGYVPPPWRIKRVLFIPKRGQASDSTKKDYRPTSLSSFVLKCWRGGKGSSQGISFTGNKTHLIQGNRLRACKKNQGHFGPKRIYVDSITGHRKELLITICMNAGVGSPQLWGSVHNM